MKKEKYIKVKFTSTIDESKGINGKYLYANSVKAKLFDTVLVPTMYGVSLAYVTEVLSLTDDEAENECSYKIREAIEVVKGIKYFEQLVRNEKAKALKKAMKERMKVMEEIQLFEMYAEKDPELKEMLKEFKMLGGE